VPGLTNVTYETDGPVGIITLNRPKYRNAQSWGLLDDFDTALDMAMADDNVRCVLLKAAGEHFSSGHDLGSPDSEAERAAAALSVHDIQFFDLGDYPLELDREAKYRLVDVMRAVQPAFVLSHSQYDPYNTDHMYATQVALETRMIAQAWGHNPGEKVLGAPQLYLFEPHQTEQMGWKPDTFLDITPVWDKKRAAIECMEGQQHLWEYYTRVAQNRANHFKRNSGGQSGGRDCKYAEGFQSVFPRTVDEL